jgi:hypothetical protein
VSARGYAPRHIREQLIPEYEPLVLALSSGFSIPGRVFDEAGKPVDNAAIAAENRSFPNEGVEAFSLIGTTDADGRFLLPNAADGRYRIRATSADPREPIFFPEVVATVRNDDADPVRINGEPAAVLIGRYESEYDVRISFPRPIAIHIASDTESIRETRANDDNTFAVRVPTNSSGSIDFRGQSGFVTQISARSMESDFEIDEGHVRFDHPTPGVYEGIVVAFRLAGVVSGTVTDANGQPLSGHRVLVEPRGYNYTANDEGVYAAEIPPDENVTLRVTAPQSDKLLVRTNAFTLSEGEVKNIDIVVPGL